MPTEARFTQFLAVPLTPHRGLDAAINRELVLDYHTFPTLSLPQKWA